MAETANPQNFEQALSRLEDIIKMMEAHDLPLEDMLAHYEEGINLVKYCGEKLDHAEQRIKIITENGQAKPELVDFEPSKMPPAAALEPPVAATPEATSRPSKAGRSAPVADSDSAEVSLF